MFQGGPKPIKSEGFGTIGLKYLTHQVFGMVSWTLGDRYGIKHIKNPKRILYSPQSPLDLLIFINQSLKLQDTKVIWTKTKLHYYI